MATNQAFSRTLIDAQLGDSEWRISDGVNTHFECLLCDRSGRRLAVVEPPLPNGPDGRIIEYVIPFALADRETDYRITWKFFEEQAEEKAAEA